MSGMKKQISDWMVRISFAEADAADAGFRATGTPLDRKTRLALDQLTLVRSVATASREIGGRMSAEESQEAKGASAPLSVMVVDDEPIVGKRLAPVLEKAGFEVEFFTEPTRALERLAERPFDIVVTDLRMEEVDGIRLLEYVMANCASTRVILITGYATVEVAREALVKGAFDFIAKPFKPNDLRAVVTKAALSLGHGAIG